MLHNLAENLRRLRRSLDLSQTSLASSLGFRQQYVSALEHGLRPTDPKHIEALAEALGVSQATLLKRHRRVQRQVAQIRQTAPSDYASPVPPALSK